MATFTDALLARALVCDGGLATALEARGHNLAGGLWSARLLLDTPDEIAAVHRAFFAAGADIAITASYQASFRGFANCGIGRRGTERLLRRSVRIAADVRDEFGRGFVAASIGPYGAAAADGSEYKGRYGLSVRELRAWHRPRFEILADTGADVLAVETIPDLDEAEALASLISEFRVPAWLSYTIAGARTRAGQPVSDAFEVASEIDSIVAVGVNCCAPADVIPTIDTAQHSGKPVIVYPNSGEGWDAEAGRWTGKSEFSVKLARQWAAAGAQIIGGCCRVGAGDIAQVASALSRPT
ncbi:homocysteine S-methyltransferase [Hoyosella subflava]|uniref:Homocysteine methyltransferase n=1 Tax=Hoyosella subflava (strain DSM 45089 / JCM 17490 / NBRC 109087 / DQS3-9A1) TaxID=443218 RepID=F6EKP5_HOYSD|nr:homocysteine S-methyltransferase [Hoyosella subflava]AEF40181.1 homocysteine methyltransferase [Hoyosella subflava DQS3-9A1]